MTFGPDEILLCPSCRQLFTRNTYSSGNTFGSISWSDGESFTPMMPSGPLITLCGNCGITFFTEDVRHVGFVPLGTFMNEPFELPSYDSTTLEEFIRCLKKGLHGDKPRRELLLRIRIWWKHNDPHRDSGMNTVHSNPAAFRENLERIHKLALYTDNPESRLIISETLRELERYDESIEFLDKLIGKYKEDPWNEHILETASKIKNEALKKNPRVFKLTSEPSDSPEFPSTPPMGGIAGL